MVADAYVCITHTYAEQHTVQTQPSPTPQSEIPEKHATRPSINVVEIGTHPPHSGCVNDGCQACKPVQQHLVKQRLIAILQGLHGRPFAGVFPGHTTSLECESVEHVDMRGGACVGHVRLLFMMYLDVFSHTGCIYPNICLWCAFL